MGKAIIYGRSVVTIADQLYGQDKTMSTDEKIKQAQAVYDKIMLNVPGLRDTMVRSQSDAKHKGYVETILGRRRHIPDMQLPEFEFKAMPGYINPDIDPTDLSTLDIASGIPERITKQLYDELVSCKYYGQVQKKIKELLEQNIRVINNRYKIAESSRQCLNSIIQGSAADMTKLAMILIEQDPEWNELGARLLLPVHDELIAEVPIANYERASERLSTLMCEAANFLPFEMKCDVEVTYRWYGREFPCQYTKPDSLDSAIDNEVKWVQYHLHEMEYSLPVISEGGEKPQGDAAVGINGVVTDEYSSYIQDYMRTYQINRDAFIDHIHKKVHEGV